MTATSDVVSRGAIAGGILDAARHGDGDAFMTLWDESADRLRGLAFRTLGDASMLDDAMQEVAIKAFRGLRDFQGTSALSTWLYQITFRTCLNLLRGRGRTLPQPDIDATLPHDGSDPGESALLRLELSAALASLSPEHRAVVFLVLEHGLDYHTAAGVLGVPVGTVASRLSVARTALCACLTGHGDDGKGP